MENKTILRLRTLYWHDFGSLHIKKTLTVLKRKSSGINMILEDCQQIGAEETIPRINNLDSCVDGIYELVVDHVGRDWETGCIEDWDYTLIPYKEEKA